ncbi:MAG: tetratricopeptide repeat protein [Geobacteraceae bacterium]
MSKENILYTVIALLVGILGTVLVVGVVNKNQSATEVNGTVSMGGGSPIDYKARIAEAEKIVVREPNNLPAWIQLGNDYFDTDQPQKAINAYAKALELDPRNPNVLTDQGIMFRKVGWFDKAISNFKKARKLDPGHLQSIYNTGLVYADDLKQPDKALQAWSLYLQLDTTSPTAQQVKGMVKRLKTVPQKGK